MCWRGTIAKLSENEKSISLLLSGILLPAEAAITPSVNHQLHTHTHTRIQVHSSSIDAMFIRFPCVVQSTSTRVEHRATFPINIAVDWHTMCSLNFLRWRHTYPLPLSDKCTWRRNGRLFALSKKHSIHQLDAKPNTGKLISQNNLVGPTYFVFILGSLLLFFHPLDRK